MGGNPSDIVERRAQEEQGAPDIVITDISGLSLKLDLPNQPNNVWRELNNLDLYIPGSIRKVLPPVLYGQPGPTAPILNFINYWAQPNQPGGPTNRLLGLSSNGIIWDLTTGTVWADISAYVGNNITTVPYLNVYPLYFNPFTILQWGANLAFDTTDAVIKYGAYDGVLRIYSPAAPGNAGATEPIWTTPTTVDGGITWNAIGEVKSETFQQNTLLVLVPGQAPIFVVEYRYNPANPGEVPSKYINKVGIQQPLVPANVVPVTVIQTLNGYFPIAGRGFVYTLYNSHSFHESSPSPFVGGSVKIEDNTNANQVKTIPGSLLPPLPVSQSNAPYQSYQSYYIAVPLSVVQAGQAQGCDQMYFYATRDGGATFYRITTLLDNNDNIISNADGSVLLSKLVALQAANGWTDQFPLVNTPMPAEASCRVYEGGGPINLVPAWQTFNPANWTSANANQIVIVPGAGASGDSAAELNQATPVGGGAQPKSTLRSSPIPVTQNATYIFQGYINATDLDSGLARFDIVSPDYHTTYMSWTQTPGTTGYVGGTWTKTPDMYNFVRVRIFANHCVIDPVSGGNDTGNSMISWSEPRMYAGTVLPTQITQYPTPDEALVLPAPAALTQQAPPDFNLIMQIYGGALFLVEQGTFRIWFSNSGDFQSYGAFSYLPLDDDAGVPVLELANIFSQLIVGKDSSISAITGGGTRGFLEVKYDPNHGVKSVRSSLGFGTSFLTFINTGITDISLGATLVVAQQAADTVSTGFRAQNVIGDPIKPLTDTIDLNTLYTNVIKSPCSAIDSNQNFFLFSFHILGLPYILISNMAHRGPSSWSLLHPYITNGAGIAQMREVLRPDTNSNAVLISDVTSHQVQVVFGGTQANNPLIAQATTWYLPDLRQIPAPERDTIKVFHEMWVEGEDIANWTYEYSVDYNTFVGPFPLRVRNRIGTNGRQISFRFTHAVNSNVVPMLSLVKITQSVRRQASGQNGF